MGILRTAALAAAALLLGATQMAGAQPRRADESVIHWGPSAHRFVLTLGVPVLFGHDNVRVQSENACGAVGFTVFACGERGRANVPTVVGAFAAFGLYLSPWLRGELQVLLGGRNYSGSRIAPNVGTFSGTARTHAGFVVGVVDIGGFFAPGTLGMFHPFVGLGIGLAHNRLSDIVTSGGNRLPDGSRTNFAWTLVAGTGIGLAWMGLPDWARLRLAYRLMDLGRYQSDAGLGRQVNNATFAIVEPTYSRTLHHGVELGIEIRF